MGRCIARFAILGTAWLSCLQSGLPQGTIAYYQPDTPIAMFTYGFADYYSLDFDRDANPELTFAYSFAFLGVRSEAATRILTWMDPPPNLGGSVAPLPFGFAVGQDSEVGSLQWFGRVPGAPYENAFNTLVACYDVGCTGDFRGQHAYMGVEFERAGATHYGWVLLNITPHYPSGTIEAWAWETQPGQPIFAGAGLDSDHDGVWDYLDQCPNTPPGAVVDTNGCSIAQLCPCNGPWKNHGEYVKAVESVAKRFVQEGRITEQQRAAIVKQAANSDCGKPR